MAVERLWRRRLGGGDAGGGDGGRVQVASGHSKWRWWQTVVALACGGLVAMASTADDGRVTHHKPYLLMSSYLSIDFKMER